VWTWDITKLATVQRGVFLMAYVIIDLFSRYVVGWMLATKECKHLAAQLFAETIARHGVEPGLLVHADRGSAMKSDTLAQLLASLGASRSFSRPRVSNDNPFSEAQFKTLKYQPDYPGRFDGELHARGYLQDFFGWHNNEHHHSGLALFTPSDVFHGRVEEVRAVRQAALDDAYRAHPERFPNGPPRVPLPPAAVHINPLVTATLSVPADPAAEVPPRDAGALSGPGDRLPDATLSGPGDRLADARPPDADGGDALADARPPDADGGDALADASPPVADPLSAPGDRAVHGPRPGNPDALSSPGDRPADGPHPDNPDVPSSPGERPAEHLASPPASLLQPVPSTS